jgi:hypothetical protein
VVEFTLATLKLYNQAPQHFEFLLPSNGVALTARIAEDLVHSSSIGLGSIQNANEDVMNIYVGNLPFTITEDKLKDLFVGFGEVTRINLIAEKATGELRGSVLWRCQPNRKPKPRLKASMELPLGA